MRDSHVRLDGSLYVYKTVSVLDLVYIVTLIILICHALTELMTQILVHIHSNPTNP